MIERLDSIAVGVADLDGAVRDCSAMLGCTPPPISTTRGAASARLVLGNMALALSQGSGLGDATLRPPSPRLVLAVTDMAVAVHRLERRGVAGTARPGEPPIVDFDTNTTHGVPISIAGAGIDGGDGVADAGADIAGLDHVVVRTPDPERAVALYGGRLGLDLRLDRRNEALGSRMLFFVIGNLVIEVVHDMKKGVGTGLDRIFGLAWRARDIDRARARMAAAGIDVSDVREGRRPATRVFTVRSHNAGLPTLVIGGDGLDRR